MKRLSPRRDGFPARERQHELSGSNRKTKQRKRVRTISPEISLLSPSEGTVTSSGDLLRLCAPFAELHRMPPIRITCGAVLCELRIWATSELPESKEMERVLILTRIPGLGWIGAVPMEFMN